MSSYLASQRPNPPVFVSPSLEPSDILNVDDVRARNLARLNLPLLLDELALITASSDNLVKILGVNPDLSIKYEYLEGPTAEEYFQDPDHYFCNLSYCTQVELCEELGAGLMVLHSNGFLHRDFNLSNVRVHTRQNEPIPYLVLADLETVVHSGMLAANPDNISGSKERDLAKRAWTYDRVGTPGYAAPELLSNGADGFSVASDIYALGKSFCLMMLYHLGDEVVYSNGTLRLSNQEIVDAITQNYGWRTALILSCSLARIPKYRFSSVETFLDALENSLSFHES